MPFPRIPRNRWAYQRQPNWSDVYWFDFSFPVSGQQSMAHEHPALVISNANVILPGTIEIVPLSGAENARPGYTFHVAVTKAEASFLDKDSIAKVDQIFCVLTRELPDQHYIGSFSPDIMRRIYIQLLKALGVDKLLP